MSKKKTKTRDPSAITWAKYHKRSLEITRKTAPPFGEFEKMVLGMDQEIESSPFWRGDLYNQGLTWYKDDQVHQLFGPRTAWKTWQNNASVCGRVDPSRRREDIECTYSHHAEVAYLAPKDFIDPDLAGMTSAQLQDYYLQLTIDNHLTVTQLRAKIKYDKGEGPDPLGDRVSFQKGSIPIRIEKLQKKLSGIIEDMPDEWDEERSLLLQAEKHVVSALNSAQNRQIGEPAEIPEPEPVPMSMAL